MKITLKKIFLKDLKKVSEPQKSEVKAFLEQLSTNPHILKTFRHTKKLQDSKKGNFFRIRFGDYRLGYEKRDNEVILYRIRFRGSLAEQWFDDLGDIRCRISEPEDRKPATTLVGRFRDQAALLGMLNTIYDLHLPLLEVEYLEDAPPAGEASGNKGVPPG